MKINPDLLAKLSSLPAFPDAARELIRVCGLKAAAALMREWPGLEFPVPTVDGGGNQAGARRFEQLVEVVGETAAAALIRHYRGCRLYIPNLKVARHSWLQGVAHKEYERLVMAPNRYTHDQAISEMALRFGVASRSVERWLARPITAPDLPPRQDQMPLFR